MSTEKQTIDLGALSTKKANVKEASANPKGEASFTKLPGESISLITDFMGYQKVNKRFNDAGTKVYLSKSVPVNNSQITSETLEGIVSGAIDTTNGENDIKGFSENELITASEIYSLFYSKEAPRTKAHSYGFYINTTGKTVFLAQQGCSIKEYVLF